MMLVCLVACGGGTPPPAREVPANLPTAPTAAPPPSAAGTYELDREATKAATQKDIDQLPEDQRQLAQLGMAMMDKMSLTMTLAPSGEVVMHFEMENSRDSEKRGTWAQHGDEVVLTGEDGKSTQCRHTGAMMTCEELRRSGNSHLVFRAPSAQSH